MHWSLTVLAASPRAPHGSFTAALIARIDPGWHLYALDEPEGGPLATEITLAAGQPLTLLRVDQARPSLLPDAFFRQPTGLFRGTAHFTLRLEPLVGPPTTPIPLRVQVRYQACSDRLCLPPRTELVALAPNRQ